MGDGMCVSVHVSTWFPSQLGGMKEVSDGMRVYIYVSPWVSITAWQD